MVGLCAALLAGAGQTRAASPPASSWDVSGEFNDVSPTGPVWSYGQLPLGGSFTPFTGPATSSQCLLGYQPPASALVAHNPQVTLCVRPTTPGNITFAPRALLLHPGPSGQAAVVRFTAPVSAQYRVSGQFYAMDGNYTGTQTGVSIVANYSPTVSSNIFTGNLSYPAVVQSSFTTRTVMLQANQTLDFRVKAAPNYNYASTGLHAVIEKTGPWCGLTDPSDPRSSTC